MAESMSGKRRKRETKSDLMLVKADSVRNVGMAIWTKKIVLSGLSPTLHGGNNA